MHFSVVFNVWSSLNSPLLCVFSVKKKDQKKEDKGQQKNLIEDFYFFKILFYRNQSMARAAAPKGPHTSFYLTLRKRSTKSLFRIHFAADLR